MSDSFPDYEAAGFAWSLASTEDDWWVYASEEQRKADIAQARLVVDAALGDTELYINLSCTSPRKHRRVWPPQEGDTT